MFSSDGAWSAAEGGVYLSLGCYAFLGVSILCDDYLCPALDKLCDQYKIPPSIAAATLISFGSSAPEIIISTLGAAKGNTLLSIPAVLVSALIAFGAIPPLVVLAAGPITLRVGDILRDAAAYAFVLGIFIMANESGAIGQLPSAVLVGCYLIYLVIVYKCRDDSQEEDAEAAALDIGDLKRQSSGGRTSLIMKRQSSGTPESGSPMAADKRERSVSISGANKPERDLLTQFSIVEQHLRSALIRVEMLEEKLLGQESPRRESKDQIVDVKEPEADAKNGEDEDDGDDEEEAGPVMKCLCLPWETMLERTVPEESAIGGFAMSMAWLCLMSYLAMYFAEHLVRCWKIGTATAGITLLAWGGQLPDTLAAVSLAKSGKPNEAICQAIASQVINISLGLGLPLWGHAALTGKPNVTQSHVTVLLIAACVLCSIVVYVLALLPTKNGEGTFTNLRAGVIGAAYVVLYAGSIYFAETGQ